MNTSDGATSRPLPAELLAKLEAVVGKEALLTDAGDCWPYGYDNSRRQALPQAVIFAVDHRQVVDIVVLCNRYSVALIPRGAGTGTTGATVPDHGGIVLSLERMNRILRIDPDNRSAHVQPGVTNQELQEALSKHGFFWPPDPTSAAVCTLGGNLAYNSAGPRAVKYGTPRENTLGLRAVTGAGREFRTGVQTSKGVVGYDLTRLIIGSEGTLAIITEAVLKLTPLAEAKTTLQASYQTIHSAATAVSAIMAQPITPCALEFMDRAAIDMVRGFSGIDVVEGAGALLMIEVDGPAHSLQQAAAAVEAAASVEGLIDIHRANTPEEVELLWKTRRSLSPALRNIAPKKINEDVVVPVSRIPELIEGLEHLAREHHIRIVNFGHAGNGNIHVNLLVNPANEAEMTRARACLDATFNLVLKLDGTLSGEHGVGLEKRDFIDRELDPITLDLMRGIKTQFDPNNILNPGKLLPLTASDNSGGAVGTGQGDIDFSRN